MALTIRRKSGLIVPKTPTLILSGKEEEESLVLFQILKKHYILTQKFVKVVVIVEYSQIVWQYFH